MEVSKPVILDPQNIFVRITGTTICSLDIHLLHATILHLEKGDLLSHEFIGFVESVGPSIRDLRVEQRVVNSFCTACGECRYCKEDLTTACGRTNASQPLNPCKATVWAAFLGAVTSLAVLAVIRQIEYASRTGKSILSPFQIPCQMKRPCKSPTS